MLCMTLRRATRGGINLRPVAGNNHIVRNNVVYHIFGHPKTKGSGVGIVTGKNVEVYNNIVYNNERQGIRVMEGAKVYHNTIYGHGSVNLTVDGKNADIKNNIGTTLKGNIAASKSLFVDADGHDFRLRDGSAAIDTAGRTDVDTDIAGVARPQGNGADYGALEANGGSRNAVAQLTPPKRFRLITVRQ